MSCSWKLSKPNYLAKPSNAVEPEDQEYVEKVLEAAHEAVNITTNAREITTTVLQSEDELSPVSLRSVLDTQIEEVQEMNERAAITTADSIPDVEVLADDMLQSVFRNLLNNAIFHNDKELPEVSVSATTTEETVTVDIADNGPGISDKHKDDIFEEGETGIDSEGTGLGLHLVDTLINRYDGAVRVEDNEPEGSIFTVELQRR